MERSGEREVVYQGKGRRSRGRREESGGRQVGEREEGPRRVEGGNGEERTGRVDC